MRRVDWAGAIFGHARVIELAGGSDTHRSLMWLVRCGCGRVFERSSVGLRDARREKRPIHCLDCAKEVRRIALRGLNARVFRHRNGGAA